jgi:frataxin-like iron-binding protein CyaY
MSEQLDLFFENAKHQLDLLEERLLNIPDEVADLDCDLVDTKMTVKIRAPQKADWVISTNSGALQIWIAALGKSFKLNEDGQGGFVLLSTNQSLLQVLEECLTKHLGRPVSLVDSRNNNK